MSIKSNLFSDKNRVSAYTFTFGDYVSRVPLYFPKNYQGFQELPQGYDPFKKPDKSGKATAWLIGLTG